MSPMSGQTTTTVLEQPQLAALLEVNRDISLGGIEMTKDVKISSMALESSQLEQGIASFEADIKASIAKKDLSGVVVLASNTSGTFNYAKAFGPSSLENAESPPIDLDATFYLASCTKLVTSIAALQCVERGLITLDEDISRVLPEMKNKDILTGFDEESGAPILVKSTKAMTLRHLLTHSSGLTYDIFNPTIRRWRAQCTPSIPLSYVRDGTIPQLLDFPLLFEPGTSWNYSVGLDWVGVAVSRLAAQPLSAFFEAHIFAPLGITALTFHPERRPDVMARLAGMAFRDGPVHPEFAISLAPPGARLVHSGRRMLAAAPQDEFGSNGLVGGAADFFRVLRDLARPRPTLLRDAALVRAMFAPALPTDAARRAHTAYWANPRVNAMFGRFPHGARVDFGLGGEVNLDDVEGETRAGTLAWSGLPGCYWWVDREAGVCGLYASQVLPMGDPKSVAMNKKFQSMVYGCLRDGAL